jgi:hypothetical protein
MGRFYEQKEELLKKVDKGQWVCILRAVLMIMGRDFPD